MIFAPRATSHQRGVRGELLAWGFSLLRLRRTVGCRIRIGRFEADRIDRHIFGRLYLVEVRSRRTCILALASVGADKQRRLAVMAKCVANATGEPVTVEVEAVGTRRIVRRVLGVVQPDTLGNN